jgi:hypothetical protein
MVRGLICAVGAIAMVASTSRPAGAVAAGSVLIGAPVRVEIATVTGASFSTATIFELGNARVRDVVSLTASPEEVQAVELTPSQSTRRLVVEVDVPPGGSVRVSVTSQGTPVFPDETITADKRYVLEPF